MCKKTIKSYKMGFLSENKGNRPRMESTMSETAFQQKKIILLFFNIPIEMFKLFQYRLTSKHNS